MSAVKYTKTATFLFPLLEISKDFFKCDIKNSFGTTMFHTRFINAYLYNDDLITDSCIHIVINNYQDPLFSEFYKTMVSLENYVDDYEKHNCLVMIMAIPECNLLDFNYIVSGQYSKVSNTGKTKIFKNAFYSGNLTVLPMIFSKALALKEMWEEKLSNPHPNPVINYIADLGDQEVWGIIDPEKETLTEETFKLFHKPKISLSK